MLAQRFIRYGLLATLGWSLPGVASAQFYIFGTGNQPSSAAIVKKETERVLAQQQRKEAAKQSAKTGVPLGNLFNNIGKQSPVAPANNSSKASTGSIKQPQLMTTKPAKEMVRQPAKPFVEGSFTGNLSKTSTSAAAPVNTHSTCNFNKPANSGSYSIDKNCWDPSARKNINSESPMATVKQRPVWNHLERQGKSIDERCWVPAGRLCETTRPWLCAPGTGEVTIRVNSQYCRPDYYKYYAVSRNFGFCYEGFYHNHWHSSRWNLDHGCWMHFDRGVNSWYYWCAPDRCYYPVSYKPYNSFTCENMVSSEQAREETIPPLPGRDE